MSPSTSRPARSAARCLVTLSCLALLLLGAGCRKDASPREVASSAPVSVAASTSSAGAAPTFDALAESGPAAGRRVIRTAELSLAAEAPELASTRLEALADRAGGFVVSSETSRSGDAQATVTTVVIRVPARAFDAALAGARALGASVASEKVTGQDVTEEYVDLEGRLRTQRAIEDQLLGVLKEAHTIPDILAVQQKLGEVRGEIDRAEGRRRFLESQTSLSTLTVHIARPAVTVATGTGFGQSAREAASDGVAVAVAIVNGAIRVAGVLLPVGVLVVAPVVLLLQIWRRRRRALSPPLPLP